MTPRLSLVAATAALTACGSTDGSVPLAAGTQPTAAVTALGRAPADPMPCASPSHLAAIQSLLRDGLAAGDESAVDGLDALTASVDGVVAGRLEFAVRSDGDSATSDGSVTLMAVSGLAIIHGSEDMTQLVRPSTWSRLSERDPLEDRVTFDGVRFVAYVERVDGSWVPRADGMVIGCADPTTPVVPLLDLPPGTDGLTIDEVVETARAAAAPTITDPIPGPVFTHPEVSTSNEGTMAEVGGVLELEDGCLRFVGDSGPGIPMVWPNGTTWDPDEQAVVLADGGRIGLGDSAIGGGGYLTPDVLRRGFEPELAEPLIACAEGEFAEVAVINNFPGAIVPG